MKKILLICAVVLSMFACKKDDVVTPIAQQDILGKWNVTQLWDETQNKWNDVPAGKMYAQFNADYTYVASGGRGTYTIEGNVIVCKVGNIMVKYEFKLNGNNAEATVTEGPSKPFKVKVTRS